MDITRNGYYRIQGPDGNFLLDDDGNIRQVTSRDEAYEHITNDAREGEFVITCPNRTVKKKLELMN